MGAGVGAGLVDIAQRMDVQLTVNGRVVEVQAEQDMPLLWVLVDLLDLLDLTGTRLGCGVSAWSASSLSRSASTIGGSTSVIDAWDVVRTAAATARASLLGAVALQWKLPVDELSVREGVVHHGWGGSAIYGQLARFTATTPPGSGATQAARAVARNRPGRARLDVPSKVDGMRFSAWTCVPRD